MLLERTIFQLDVGHVPDDQAEEMGQLGYIQWLGSLRADACYVSEAWRARQLAQPFLDNSPAVAVFCDLLDQSIETPTSPMSLRLPERLRRGGAQARRMSL